MSEKKSLSLVCIFLYIAYLTKKQLVCQITMELKTHNQTEEFIHQGKGRVSLQTWSKSELVITLDKLLIDSEANKNSVVKAKMAELQGRTRKELLSLRKKAFGVVPKKRSSADHLRHDVFCKWFQEELQIPHSLPRCLSFLPLSLSLASKTNPQAELSSRGS